MEILLRCLMLLVKFIYWIVYPVLLILMPREKNRALPPIKNELLIQPINQLVEQLRTRKLQSKELVSVYIERIKEVDTQLQAVVEERFNEALIEAQQADELITHAADEQQLEELYANKPLLGIPFTVKEACGHKGMSHVVGSLQRIGMKSNKDGQVVQLIKAAGAIPLLVSSNPEYCFSIETNTYINGMCANPYDFRRSAGGSSGGEGALNGAGATVFGVGSDIAGSIRLPSLFNGVFGHKPTGGLTSVQGHFPDSNDPNFDNYLQLGPITRFSQDLPLLLRIMAGKEADKLNLEDTVEIKNLKIYYSLGFSGLNGFFHSTVAVDIKLAIRNAVEYFQKIGLTTQEAKIKGFHNSTEIGLSGMVRLNGFPFLINKNDKKEVTIRQTLWEYLCSTYGQSQYTKDALVFEIMRRSNGFMPAKNMQQYTDEAARLKAEIIELLGDNGVLLFPTFLVPAIHHHTSHLPIWGIDYTLIFNILGLPATHIPTGLDALGLPIGFQVIASPYMDKLCFEVASELEQAFGGWIPPTRNCF